MKQHITRAYNKFDIDAQRGILTKISEESRLKDEIDYYDSIQGRKAAIWFPRFLGGGPVGTNQYSLNLEYYAYKNLGDLMIYNKFDKELWLKIIDRITLSLADFGIKDNSIIDGSRIQREMYIEKTLKYYYELVGKFPKFRSIANHFTLSINGKEYMNFDSIWPDIEKEIEKIIAFGYTPSMIHGDMCFSNILFGEAKTGDVILKYVDPRGSFGAKGVYGDPLYDVAKLRHSFEGGYEYIIYDHFNLKEDDNLQEFEFNFRDDNREEISKLFNEDLILGTPVAKLIEGLIFIGMCSRHYDSLDRQTVMYLTGIKILNEALEELK